MTDDAVVPRYVRLMKSLAQAESMKPSSALDIAVDSDATAAQPAATGRLEDSAGHARPVYVGLAAATVIRRHGLLPGWERRCEALLMDWPTSPTADGALLLAGAAWADYALWLGQKSDGSILRAACQARQKDGPFLLTEGADNPEPWWFAELAILHAVTSYALLSGEPRALEAAEANAMFHLAETQPDHATSQPWGINAFVAFNRALPLADQVLLAMQTQQPHGLGPVSRMLLLDAVAALSAST